VSKQIIVAMPDVADFPGYLPYHLNSEAAERSFLEEHDADRKRVLTFNSGSYVLWVVKEDFVNRVFYLTDKEHSTILFLSVVEPERLYFSKLRIGQDVFESNKHLLSRPTFCQTSVGRNPRLPMSIMPSVRKMMDAYFDKVLLPNTSNWITDTALSTGGWKLWLKVLDKTLSSSKRSCLSFGLVTDVRGVSSTCVLEVEQFSGSRMDMPLFVDRYFKRTGSEAKKLRVMLIRA